MRSRRSDLMEERSGLDQGRTQVAEGSKLQLQQENLEGALAGVGSPPSIAMRGELQGGSRDSGASPFHVDCTEIPPSPPTQAPVQGPDPAAFGISKAAEVAVPANDSVQSEQTPSPGDCVDNRNLLSRSKGKSLGDSHDPDGFYKELDPVGPAPVPAGSHSSHEDEHGSRSQSQMRVAKNSNDRSASIPWMGLQCSRCKSANFGMYTEANAESVDNRMHYQCNNCKQLLCRENVRSYKMRNLKPSTLTASNSNMKAMPPPSNPNMKAMPPPSSTHKPNVCLPDSQDAAFRFAKTTLPSRSSICSDKQEEDHPSRESNLQLVGASEPEERFPMKILEAKGPFHLSANLKEPPSNQSAKGNQKETSFANDGFPVKGLRDSIRGHRSSLLEENKKGSGGGTVSDVPCPSCKSTNTRFCCLGRYYCDNCREYWNLGHLQQHEAQLPSKQTSKGKEKEKETTYEDADQFSGKGLGDSSCGPRSLRLNGSEDGDGGSNEGPLNALSCSRCKSTFTRLCTYGVFCDACGKYSPFAGTRDLEVPANPPLAMVHEVLDADGRSRDHQLQSLPPPQRPIMVDALTQTDPVVMVPLDSRFGKHIVHGLLHTHSSGR